MDLNTTFKLRLEEIYPNNCVLPKTLKEAIKYRDKIKEENEKYNSKQDKHEYCVAVVKLEEGEWKEMLETKIFVTHIFL